MAATLTYFDVYADYYRRGLMTEGRLVSAVKLGRITLPEAREIKATEGKCGALWTPPAPEPTPAPTTPTPTDPTPQTPASGDAAPEGSSSEAAQGGAGG